MIVTEYARTLTFLLLLCTSIKSSHSQRTYDKGDWIPLVSSCPTCQPGEQSENRKIAKKEATGRVLNIGQDDHPNQFVNNDKYVPYSGDPNFRLEEADSYEDFRNYYNFNKPIQRQQESLQDTDSYVEETSKRQQLLAQKALEPLFLNQELLPPKPVSVDNQEQTNNLYTSNSKEQSYQNSPRLDQHSTSQLQTSNTADNNPPVRFNLLQSNIQSTQHSLESPKLETNQSFSVRTDNENTKSSNNQQNQYSPDRHSYNSSPFTNSPTFQTLNSVTDKKANENRPPGAFQFNVQSTLNKNRELNNIQNPLPPVTKESDIRSQGESVALPLQNRFSESPSIPLLKSLSDSDVNPNFSPPQLRNVIQDVNAGLQPELPQSDKVTPSLYQQTRTYTNKGSKPIEITTPTSQPNKEGVELLYVPVQYLNKNQEQPKYFSTPEDKIRSSFPQNRQSSGSDELTGNFQKTSTQPFKQAQQIEGIQNDFSNQALGALKLQHQLHSGEIPITSPPNNNFVPSSSTKPIKKKKSHQPPLAVYMESDGSVKISDVLNLLKSSRSISVQDTVGPDTPPVFVGPYDLESPEGYAKFELPYLSSLDANQIEARADEFPFFVAPMNYRAPEGYSKIPLPSPHVGTIVLSEKTNGKGTFSKTPPHIFASVPSREIPERKQHYRDTLDQPNYQTKFLPSNVETPLSIRQTTDHNDHNQLNNHFLHPNQRIPSSQSKFEEEYNRINNIYRTTPKPEISKFVITTSTPSPLREQQQYVYNPQTGFIEPISQTQPFLSQQYPVQGSSALLGSRGELTNPSLLRENPPTRDITEYQPTSTKSQEKIPSRSQLTESPKHSLDFSTTLKPLRGRFRETNDQISTKPTRGRGSSHYSSSSYDEGDKHDLERPKSVQRNRGNNANRNRVSTARIKEETNQQWQKHVEEPNLSNPTVIGSRPTSLAGVIYSDDGQSHTNNLNNLDKTFSKPQNSVNIPQVPYYEEVSDIQTFNQQVPTSMSLKDREEAKQQRTQSVSSLEQNLGIPITSNGASGILSQSAGDDSYSDPLLKSTEEPVFEFTTRSQPARSRPSTFESYELDSTHSDESREFDDFFLSSSEHEEEPKNFKLPSQMHSVNPALPGLINNLQDQSIRSILNPALIAPTTQQSIDEITSSQRMKFPHTDATIHNQNSFLKPQQSYQAPQAPSRATENYEINTQQQKHTLIADTRRNPLHLESHRATMERPTALPTNEQHFSNLQPTGSFSLAPQSVSSPPLQSLDSSTHLPTIETTTLAKRGRGRFRSRGQTVSTTTTAPTRRNLHRTRRPLKVESRSESLDNHQTASSTYSPVKLSDTAPVNVRYQTINNLSGLGQYHKSVPQEKSEQYQKVQVVPEYEIMPNSSSIQFERQGARLNTYYNQPTLKEYVADPTNTAPNNFMPSNGAMSTLPIYHQENMNVDLSPNQPTMFNRDIQMHGISHLTAPSASGAEQTQSHSSNVQFVHPDDYSNNTFINFIPNSNSQNYEGKESNQVKGERDNLEGNSQHLNYNTAPSAEAAISKTIETTTAAGRSRVRGRTGIKHASSTVPVTERSKATNLEKPKEENEELYGFFRSPNFNAVTSSPTPPTSHPYISSLPATGSDFTSIAQSQSGNSPSGRDNGVPYSSIQSNPETVRPRYSSVIRQPTDLDKESDSATTTKQPESTQRTRKRGRTRRPYGNAASSTRTNDHSENTYTRRYTTTERPSIRTTQRSRTRGRVHFQPPQSLKEKREDDLETANYPASFLASQGIGKQSTRAIAPTENPNFQITVESGFETNGDLAEYDQLTNPSYISTSVVIPDGKLSLANQIENKGLEKKSPKNLSTSIEPDVEDNANEKVQNNTSYNNGNKSEESVGTKKRGFWKLVKQKPLSDPLEAAESQSVGSFSANSVKISEGKDTKEYQGKGTDFETFPELTEEFEEFKESNDSVLDVSEVTTEYDLNENPEFNNTAPENSETSINTESENQNHSKSEIVDSNNTEKKSKPISSTETPPRTTNSFEKSMRTLQSTEISHETEICYRGKCIRTSNPSL